MTRARLDGLCLMLLGCVIFVSIGTFFERVASSPAAMIDFKVVYYGARCLIEHRDPYKQSELHRVTQAEGGESSSTSKDAQKIVDLCINFPTCLAFVIPFAMLPWGPAHVLWVILIAAGLILAAYLMWNVASDSSPGVCGIPLCLFLAESEMRDRAANHAVPIAARRRRHRTPASALPAAAQSR